MTTDLVRPDPALTPRMAQVVDLIAGGRRYAEVARTLRLTEGRVQKIVAQIARRLPNDDGLSPGNLVRMWAVRRSLDGSPKEHSSNLPSQGRLRT